MPLRIPQQRFTPKFLALGLLLLALALPTLAPAVGLGAMQTLSQQGQTLLAEIELRAPEYPQLQELEAGLASPRAFERSGVPRPASLQALRFQPLRLANGKTVVRVTSETPVTQTELRFLLQLSWPNGRMVRGYRVRFSPSAARPELDLAAAKPRPKPAAPKPAAPKPAAPKPAAPRRRPPAPVSSPLPAAKAAVGQHSLSAGQPVYGPVKRRDTLWGIATRMTDRPEAVPGMVKLLFEHNREAFIGGDINRLKVGYQLSLPAGKMKSSLPVAEPTPAVSRPAPLPAPQPQTPAQAKPAAPPAPPPGPRDEPVDVPEPGPASAPAPALPLESEPEPEPEPAPAPAPKPVSKPGYKPGSPEPRPPAYGPRLALVSPLPDAQLQGSPSRTRALEQQVLLAREEKFVAQQEAEELRRQVDAMAARLAELEELFVLAREEKEMAALRLQQEQAAEIQALRVMETQLRQSESIARNERILFGVLFALGLVVVILGVLLGMYFRPGGRPPRRPGNL